MKRKYNERKQGLLTNTVSDINLYITVLQVFMISYKMYSDTILTQ